MSHSPPLKNNAVLSIRKEKEYLGEINERKKRTNTIITEYYYPKLKHNINKENNVPSPAIVTFILQRSGNYVSPPAE